MERFFRYIYAAQVKEYVPPGLRSHVFVLRLTRIWPTDVDGQWYKWSTAAVFTWLGIVLPFSVFVNIFYVDTIQEAMDHTFIPLSGWGTAFKASVLYWRRDNIRQLFRIHASLLHGTGENVQIHNRIAGTNMGMHGVLTALDVIWSFVLMIQIAIALPDDRIYLSTLNFPSEFSRHFVVYWILLLYQMLGTTGITVWVSMEDSFCVALINIACGHVEDLKHKLRRLGTEFTEGEDRNARYYKDLIVCCKRYEQCLRFAGVMKDVLSTLFFVQFGLSGIVLCSTVYLLSVNNPLENSLKFIPIMIYLMCVLAQILVNCYFGSRLSYKSDEITHAIYTSPWMDRNEKCKRVVRILVERSRRPMTIYAGGVFELSLQTFLRICKAAYSCLSLLRD